MSTILTLPNVISPRYLVDNRISCYNMGVLTLPSFIRLSIVHFRLTHHYAHYTISYNSELYFIKLLYIFVQTAISPSTYRVDARISSPCQVQVYSKRYK